MTANEYLLWILYKYRAKDLSLYLIDIVKLKLILQSWANTCFVEILDSGSRAKWTAIHLASDVDYLVSLTSTCDEKKGALRNIYNSLYKKLLKEYPSVRKQNVSFRILIWDLEVDITPARKHSGNTNDHRLYVSKEDTIKQTNIQRHIVDVSQSGRLNEIKLLKIWRELNNLNFPSIYMEYLIIQKILYNKSTDINKIWDNFWYILNELAKDTNNQLFARIIDPANSANILSDLLSTTEKNLIIIRAKEAISKKNWSEIIG